MSRRSPEFRPRGVTGWLAVAFVVAVAAPTGVWLLTRSPSNELRSAGDPGLAHVHGLGTNPADGSLYIATHYGTFRLPERNQLQRVGNSFQDTMGFTVRGPDHFLGSGHPDVEGARQGLPSRLGLVESRDAGLSWSTLSLSGEADFHALAFAHDQIYGWDASHGRFMVSPDGLTWETRSVGDLYNFAVDPWDPDHLVAATPEGLVASIDGGRTWIIPLAGLGGPLAWDVNGVLWVAASDGILYRASEGGSRWIQAGPLPGAPEALAVDDGRLYLAVGGAAGSTIQSSEDGGSTWTLQYPKAG